MATVDGLLTLGLGAGNTTGKLLTLGLSSAAVVAITPTVVAQVRGGQLFVAARQGQQFAQVRSTQPRAS